MPAPPLMRTISVLAKSGLGTLTVVSGGVKNTESLLKIKSKSVTLSNAPPLGSPCPTPDVTRSV
jgi:hypothetical protein